MENSEIPPQVAEEEVGQGRIHTNVLILEPKTFLRLLKEKEVHRILYAATKRFT
jgi:hypothetical protein